LFCGGGRSGLLVGRSVNEGPLNGGYGSGVQARDKACIVMRTIRIRLKGRAYLASPIRTSGFAVLQWV
jgi:hypothetical protein